MGLKGNLGDVYIQIFGADGSYIQFATHPHPAKEEVIVKMPLDPPLKSGWEARPTMFRFKREAYAKYNVVSGDEWPAKVRAVASICPTHRHQSRLASSC